MNIEIIASKDFTDATQTSQDIPKDKFQAFVKRSRKLAELYSEVKYPFPLVHRIMNYFENITLFAHDSTMEYAPTNFNRLMSSSSWVHIVVSDTGLNISEQRCKCLQGSKL